MNNVSPLRDEVVALLDREGPLTFDEIASRLGREKRAIVSTIRYSRKTHGTKHFRYASWDHIHGSGLMRFGVGPEPDCERVATVRPLPARLISPRRVVVRMTGRRASPFDHLLGRAPVPVVMSAAA